ncbi:protein MID1-COMPLEMENTING ACTIVITY 1-like isoform X1 [Lycium ferocissimum]|uniref:protein MID1-COMPLEMENTING ACTIVITY 1-like isoform X1 n=1 Tax=Lycium ferocissimum TaxID=112874 RepID=UPI0028151846|nr:protein MID1-COMPLEMENTING ACTIVITY 1-like isoform X1 [Lycium ferocissimum]
MFKPRPKRRKNIQHNQKPNKCIHTPGAEKKKKKMEDIAQVAGVNALGLINLIITSAKHAATHKRNCEQLAVHVRLIGNLLEKLKSTDLMKLSATAEPLEGLDEALQNALELVDSCKEKSCFYMLAMGWSVVYQFRRVQNEIDRYLKLVPLIAIVHEFRMQNVHERLEAIEGDDREYTLDEEDVEAQRAVLKPDRSKKDANVLEKSLSRQYPDLRFHEALKEEKEKLHLELHQSQANNDPKQCRIIEHLIDVTQNVVSVPAEKFLALNAQPYIGTGWVSTAKVGQVEMVNASQDEHQEKSKWQTDLFDCCNEPCLSLKACIYPCGIFSRIASLVSLGTITREHALNDLMTYSLFCGCCCYTCCVRRRLRRLFTIEGGSCDDFFTHLFCCCCAMIQEWHELELRDFEGVLYQYFYLVNLEMKILLSLANSYPIE